MVAIAGVAAASSYSSSAHTAFFASGNHQFYVWCAGGADYMAQQSGNNAEDAQMRLYNSKEAGAARMRAGQCGETSIVNRINFRVLILSLLH